MTPTEALENHADVVCAGRRKAFRVEDEEKQSAG